MASITQDNKASSTLTLDNRTAQASLSQDSKTTAGALWSAGIFPWTLDFPWLWENNGAIINMDDRT
mgnify:CR=1 FL=1